VRDILIWLVQFASQPFDILFSKLLVTVGWFPILAVFIWGVMNTWKHHAQDKYNEHIKYVVLAIDVPRQTEQSPKAVENFFTAMHGGKSTITKKERWWIGKFHPIYEFSLASFGGKVQFFIRVGDKWRDLVESALYAQYPDAQISVVEDYAKAMPLKWPNDDYGFFGSEFKLGKEEYRPIKCWSAFEHLATKELKDPLAIILEQLSYFKEGENFFIQILVQPMDSQSWQKEGEEYIESMFGREHKKKKGMLSETLGGFMEEFGTQTGLTIFGGGEHGEKEEDPWKFFKVTPLDKARSESIMRKTDQIGFWTKIRWCYWAKKEVYDHGPRISQIKAWSRLFTGSNELSMVDTVTTKGDYWWQRLWYHTRSRKISSAYFNRSVESGAEHYIMVPEELASLWHFPAIGVTAPLLSKASSRRTEPPSQLKTTRDEGLLPSGAVIPRPTAQEELVARPRTALEGGEGIVGEQINIPRPQAPTTVLRQEAPKPQVTSRESEIESNAQIENIIKEKLEGSQVPKLDIPSAPKAGVPDPIRLLIEKDVEMEDLGINPAPPEE